MRMSNDFVEPCAQGVTRVCQQEPGLVVTPLTSSRQQAETLAADRKRCDSVYKEYPHTKPEDKCKYSHEVVFTSDV